MIQVGMKVRSRYHSGEEDIVRNVTKIYESTEMGSGIGACADGGDPCTLCKKRPGTAINFVDSAWFEPVKEGQ